jgi:hypothetical protein
MSFLKNSVKQLIIEIKVNLPGFSAILYILSQIHVREW